MTPNSCYLSGFIFATVAQQSILYCSCWWVLTRGLERERAERSSELRKTFRITIHFSTNKMQLRSAQQASFQKMWLQLALSQSSRHQPSHFRFTLINADLKGNYQNLRMAIFFCYLFFLLSFYLSSFSVNLYNKFFFVVK